MTKQDIKDSLVVLVIISAFAAACMGIDALMAHYHIGVDEYGTR